MDDLNLVDALDDERTLAEVQGITREMGDAIAALAEAELEAGRADAARAILEGLVVTNHRDAAAWALLSRAHRRLRQPLASRFCAEVAARLAPDDPGVRLARAESLLASPGGREAGRAELSRLAGDGQVGARARALLAALSPPSAASKAVDIVAAGSSAQRLDRRGPIRG